MKVSMENDNNFGYEKITIVVDNMSLTFNSYCRGLSDKPFICDCDMVPLQHYLSDMALLHIGATCHNKKDQSLHSLHEFEYCIQEMTHTSDRGILHTYYTICIVYTGYWRKLPGFKPTVLLSTYSEGGCQVI